MSLGYLARTPTLDAHKEIMSKENPMAAPRTPKDRAPKSYLGCQMSKNNASQMCSPNPKGYEDKYVRHVGGNNPLKAFFIFKFQPSFNDKFTLCSSRIWDPQNR